MRLDWLEPDRGGDGPLRRLDPRWKLIGAIGLVVLVVLVPVGRWRPLAGAAIALAFLAGLSGLGPGAVLRRWAAVLPVVLLLAAMIAPSHPAAAEYGVWFVAATIVAKNALAIGSVLLLGAVTPFRDLLSALARLRVPPALVATLHLMYRYLFVLADQLGRMARARRCRSYRRSRWGDWPLGSGLIAALMLRSFERGERVHAAMIARGWDGTVRGLDGAERDDG